MIPLSKPFMGDEEAQAVRRVIHSSWVSQGPETEAFEKEFAHVVRAPFACAVSSGTAALHLALLACDVGRSDEVITVSSSFIATANSIRYCDATPVFVDIDPKTFNIDPALIERAITGQTKVILCVHQMGMPCDLKTIVEIAHKHNLRVIEDAACAVGSRILWEGEWESIGKPHGDIACFSLHGRKVLSTGEGGILTTHHEEFDKFFRHMRHQGMSAFPYNRHNSPEIIFEHYEMLGYNYRLSDIQAAIGRVQLKRLPEIIVRRRALQNRYHKLLAHIPELTLPKEPSRAQGNWQSYCVGLSYQFNQRKVMERFSKSGIATRRGIMCTHREPAYFSQRWLCGKGNKNCNHSLGVCRSLHHSEYAQDHSILIPLFPQMTEKEQDTVIKTIKKVICHQEVQCV